MQGVKNLSLMDVLQGIEDPRADRVTKHDFVSILFMALCAIICDCNTYKEIETFVKERLDWFAQYVDVHNGAPSAWTFASIFRRIDPEKLHRLFIDWFRSGIGHLAEKSTLGSVLAFDGKEQKRTKGEGKRASHIVSALHAETKLVLGQVACEAKSNEITAIPELLNMLDVEGFLVTIDAMGTQKEIAELIIEGEANYLLQVKGNQPTLLEDIKETFDDALMEPGSISEDNHIITRSKGHGRIERHECWISQDLQYLSTREEWKNLATIAMIKRDSEDLVKGSKSSETMYFICSDADITAERLLKAKEEHWNIENSLHYVLDMTFNEDYSRIRSDHSAECFNVMRHIAYNGLRMEPDTKASFRTKRQRCALNTKHLESVLQNLHLHPDGDRSVQNY